MSSNSVAEQILDEKFRASYKQIDEDRRSNFLATNIEAIVSLSIVLIILLLLRYAFWGAGFSEFSDAQHKISVDMLKNFSGPHQPLLEADLAGKGYISLADYKKYMQMAQAEKAKQLKAKPAKSIGPTIVDRTADVDRSVYTSKEAALKSLQQQGLIAGQAQEQAAAQEHLVHVN